MPRRSAIEAIYLLRRAMEQYPMDQMELYLIFIDLKKTYDRVHYLIHKLEKDIFDSYRRSHLMGYNFDVVVLSLLNKRLNCSFNPLTFTKLQFWLLRKKNYKTTP